MKKRLLNIPPLLTDAPVNESPPENLYKDSRLFSWRLITVTICIVFLSQLAVVMLFSVWPLSLPVLHAIVSTVLLMICAIPALYCMWYRPILRKIQMRQWVNAKKQSQTFRDPLTALPNRYLFQQRLQHEIAIARREKSSFSVVLLDICRFTEVNKTLGHNNGDLLLWQIAQRLQDIFRESDTIARFDSDLFGILLRDVDIEHVAYAVDKLQEIMEPPFFIDEIPVELEAKFGIAIFPNHGDEPNILLQHADVALHNAKSYTESYSIYDAKDDSSTRQRLAMFGMLRTAIQNHQLILHYQPKIEIATGHVIGAEALIRWHHPELGILLPNKFIPLAEQTSIIKPLTLWVLEEVLTQLQKWEKDQIKMHVAVNFSVRNLTDLAFPEFLEKLVARYGVLPEMITIEVTESAMMSNPQRAAEVINQLHKIGFELSIDDFGTGYSSLTYLRTLPASELKIDQSFVRDMEANKNSAAIVQSVINLGHDLGLKVIAEGVENEATMNKLREYKCDFAQGYTISHPLAAAELTNWLRLYERKADR
jgi:diguanylate cyclase (GGDEF)-like protein